MSKNFVGPYNVLTEVCHTPECAKKIGQILFFTGKFAFFFKKLCFQQLLRCYRINTVTSTVNVKIPCEPSYIVPWGLSHSIMREKTGQKLFSLESLPFFKKLCFQQLQMCYRINPVTSTVIARIPCGPSYIVPWGLSHSRMRDKTDQKFFSLESLPFFKVVFSTTSNVLQN